MNVKEYLSLPLSKRQEHTNLNDDCLLRGGISTNHRGVLAQYLNTDIYSKPADLCHLCHNPDCSNPKHLYWGTRKENIADAKANGTWKSVWQRSVDKYGYEEACRRNVRSFDQASNAGKMLKGIPKTEAHKKAISDSLKHINNT